MKSKLSLVILVLVLCTLLSSIGCGSSPSSPGPRSISGVEEIAPEVKKGSDGLTTEQRNIRDRYRVDNAPGSTKHLYLISAYSGQCLLYSTVKGKVTSSGKRLSPKSVAPLDGASGHRETGFAFAIGGSTHHTAEMLQDDGTYGDSIEYLYWFDSKGAYHQQYITGGMILHISDQPITMKSIVINIEQQNKEKE